MRDYGIVSPQFWIGKTGKSLRGNLQAQVVALYLMTSPHANMIGVFYCPVDYIAKETGLGLEGAMKGLATLFEGDFCRFDEATEEVFVVRMAAYQVGESLSPADNRCKGVARELEKVTSDRLRIGFRAHYAVPFNLPIPSVPEPQKTLDQEAPCKPLRSQKQDQKQDQDQTLPGFALFWSAWPTGDRKQAKGKCLEAWKKARAEPVAALVVAHVERMKQSQGWTKNGGEFVPAPLVYLNRRSWEGAEDRMPEQAPLLAGAI